MADEADFDAAVERVLTASHTALNRIFGKRGLAPDVASFAVLALGIDCVLTNAEHDKDPGMSLLTTIKLLVDTAVREGWLPEQEAGAARVLVLRATAGATETETRH